MLQLGPYTDLAVKVLHLKSSDMQPSDWTIIYLVDFGKFKITQICESWGFDCDLKLQSGHAEKASL
jgi:hypothetical protein